MGFSTSVNIARDCNKQLDYIVTPNARQVVGKIVDAFQVGMHSFSIIGSYGTGKSSFVLAFERALQGKSASPNDTLFVNKGQFNNCRQFDFLNIVGDYAPLSSLLSQSIADCNEDNVLYALDAYYRQKAKQHRFLVIVIDEFGKILEFAAKNNPEKEMYFLQKFCEWANDTGKNILFIATLHQNFNAYSKRLPDDQRQEWMKVKGRLQEIVFKEPVEQLLSLAASKIGRGKSTGNQSVRALYDLAVESKFVKNIIDGATADALYPMDIFAAYALTEANQRYGQNERTLFSFLETRGENSIHDFPIADGTLYNLANIHDYILYNFHSALQEVGKDTVNWTALKSALERAEALDLDETQFLQATKILKTIGLLNILGGDALKMDLAFLSVYASHAMAMRPEEVQFIVRKLELAQIVRFAKYKSRYILFEGTDVDIEQALFIAAQTCKLPDNIVEKVQANFKTRISLANAHFYKTGTPRYFEYRITDTPDTTVPYGEIDGYLNILINKEIDTTQLPQNAIAYCCLPNTQDIIDSLYEIDKLEWVLNSYIANEQDKIANREVAKQIQFERDNINQLIMEGVYDGKAQWFFNGNSIGDIRRQRDINVLLSEISNRVYSGTPLFRNELINKSHPSGTISLARQNYLLALLSNAHLEDLGFPKEKFPPEKSIYLTLLKSPGIHRIEDGRFVLAAPTHPSFAPLWEACEAFLNASCSKVMPVQNLIRTLQEPPFRLKQGFIDCWLPTYLIIRRNDYSLYHNGTYVPKFSKEILDLMQRNPATFAVKKFSIDSVQQVFFDKYRETIQLKSAELNATSFIETIRPFLTFYKKLNPYAQHTKSLSANALKFREVIAHATDPEKTFFEILPEKLGFKDIVVRQNPEMVSTFVDVLQNAIRDLRTCYDDLIQQIERELLKGLGIKEMDFADYKQVIDQRYRYVKSELMSPELRNFHFRLTGNYDGRRAWVESVCYILLGKSLETLKDSEKEYLLTALRDSLFLLNDYVEMHKSDSDAVVRLHITQNHSGALTKQVVMPASQSDDVSTLEQKIEAILSDDDNLNMAALIQIIKKKLQ